MASVDQPYSCRRAITGHGVLPSKYLRGGQKKVALRQTRRETVIRYALLALAFGLIAVPNVFADVTADVLDFDPSVCASTPLACGGGNPGGDR